MLRGMLNRLRGRPVEARGEQYGALFPPPLCPVCKAEMVPILEEELPPQARGNDPYWRCPEFSNVERHPLGRYERE